MVDNLARNKFYELGSETPGFSKGTSAKTGGAESDTNISDDNLSNVDGIIAVRDGKVEMVMPKGSGKYPTITPGNDVKVFINEEEIFDTTVLTNKDAVVLVPDEEKSAADYLVEVEDDLMTAYLSVSYKKGKKYKVMDSEAQKDLVIAAKTVKDLPVFKVHEKDILNDLADKNVICYIDKCKIKVLLARSESFKREKIAQGLKPRLPVDETVEYTFQQKHKSVNNRLINEVISVEPGEVLAIKRAAVVGEPGMDLSGAIKDAPQPKRVEIKVRQGVQLIDDGSKAMAIIAGRPDLTEGYLSVFPVYNHLGNVTPDNGDIEFKGDVEISGNVEDYMIVRASGNVTVYGFVANASIHSGVT